jgi:hypothetical protein
MHCGGRRVLITRGDGTATHSYGDKPVNFQLNSMTTQEYCASLSSNSAQQV